MDLDQPHHPQFKGTAFFGMPGVGKSSVAHALHNLIPSPPVIEAGRDIIARAVRLENLPDSVDDFLHQLKDVREPIQLTRAAARDTYRTLKTFYGASIIAQALIALNETTSTGPVILSGLRGFENARYLKEHNYFVVYLHAPLAAIAERLIEREGYTESAAYEEFKEEDTLYDTSNIPQMLAHATITTHLREARAVAIEITDLLYTFKECQRCINTTINPSITINTVGNCNICEQYSTSFSKNVLIAEREWLLGRKGMGGMGPNVMVGISGGKDSTATLATVLEMGFQPLAFTFAIGYYPPHTLERAAKVAEQMHVPYERIPIAKHMRPVDRECYELTADLYDEPETEELRIKFKELYVTGRQHYSIKCTHALPFVRTCQLCRRTVIRGYYAEARARNIDLVVLGVNEWAGLSASTANTKHTISAIRKLQPDPEQPPVYVVHLPFLLQRTLKETCAILKGIGWKEPTGESLIESNSNSCRFAYAAEAKAMRLLGFHPDTTRLAREVTVGFLTKGEARMALAMPHGYPESVRDVLTRAKIL